MRNASQSTVIADPFWDEPTIWEEIDCFFELQNYEPIREPGITLRGSGGNS